MKDIIYYVVNHIEIIFSFNLIFSFLGIIILKKKRLYKNYASYKILAGLIRILIFIDFVIIFAHIEVVNQIGEKMHILDSVLGFIKIEFYIFLLLFLIIVISVIFYYKPDKDNFFYVVKFLGCIFASIFIALSVIIIILSIILVPT